MGISKIRPTAPDVKQGPQDRRKTGTKTPKGKNAVDKTPTLTISVGSIRPDTDGGLGTHHYDDTGASHD